MRVQHDAEVRLQNQKHIRLHDAAMWRQQYINRCAVDFAQPQQFDMQPEVEQEPDHYILMVNPRRRHDVQHSIDDFVPVAVVRQAPIVLVRPAALCRPRRPIRRPHHRQHITGLRHHRDPPPTLVLSTGGAHTKNLAASTGKPGATCEGKSAVPVNSPCDRYRPPTSQNTSIVWLSGSAIQYSGTPEAA